MKRKKAKITSVFLPKGGGIKTTTSLGLAYGIKIVQPKSKVLLIGGDQQRNTTKTVSPETPDGLMSLYGVLTANNDTRVNINDVIVHAGPIDLLPESVMIAQLDIELQSVLGREYKLREALKQLETEYDHIIIDLPPAVSMVVINALTASDELLIPAKPDKYCLDGLLSLQQTLMAVHDYTNPNLKVKGILIGDVRETVLARGFISRIEEIANEMDTKVFKTRIRHTVAIEEAQASCMSIYEYAPKATAAIDYMAFVKEFLEEA